MGINRKVSRKFIFYKEDPLIVKYSVEYKLGRGLIYKTIKEYGDCEFSRNFFKYLQDLTETKNKTFEDLINMFTNMHLMT